MAKLIPPRQTIYRGIKMRSRLEARYAQILDDLKVPWEYEPRAYSAPGKSQYLPDFVVDDHLFVEVKPLLENDSTSNLEPDAILDKMSVILDSRSPQQETILAVATPQLGNFHYVLDVQPEVVPRPPTRCLAAWFTSNDWDPTEPQAILVAFVGMMEQDLVMWVENGDGPIPLNWDWKR